MATMQAFVGRTHRIDFNAPYNRQSNFVEALLCLSCRPPLFMRTRVTQPSSHCTQRSSSRPRGDFARTSSCSSPWSKERRSGVRVMRDSKHIPYAGGENLGSLEPSSEDDKVAAEFQRVLRERGLDVELAAQSPTHLMPPNTVVAAQLNALQRNDWPETDAGVRAAFEFSKPHDAENLLPGETGGDNKRVHSWMGTEPWIPFKDFSNMLHSPPYSVILNCDSWQLSSPLHFPVQRTGERALQAVEVIAQRTGVDERLRPYTFTFCLEKVQSGPYKNCWMTVGLRIGDYASV